ATRTLALTMAQLHRGVEHGLGVVPGSESRQEYLESGLRELYPALEYVNTLPPESRVAFFQEVRGFYCDRDYFWANPGQNTLIPYATLPDGRALASFLRAKLGATHVLVNYGLITTEREQRWFQLLQDAINTKALTPIFATASPRTGAPRVVVYRIEAAP